MANRELMGAGIGAAATYMLLSRSALIVALGAVGGYFIAQKYPGTPPTV